MQSPNVDEFSPESPPHKKDRKDDFFIFLSTTTPSKKRHQSGIGGDLDLYISEECIEMSQNPLAYWTINESRFPHLSILAQKFLAIPATSAPAERLFSVAGKTFRPDRCCLGDATFERLVIIKSNSAI